MIDPFKVKNFWEMQALKAQSLRLEGISNLEEDPKLLDKKIKHEYKKVMDWVNFNPKISNVLDLGSGTGQWSFRFSKIAKNVTAVEYSREMLNLAIEVSNINKVENVEFIHESAQNFFAEKKFDLIWISGLLIYLNDRECEELINNCSKMISASGSLILRDATGYPNHYEINNQYSESLNSYYSACYRTAKEYSELFRKFGFMPIKDEDMFPEGSSLNKWNETRLRVYEFKLLRD